MNTFVTLSLVLGASAFAVPRSSCSFGLTASGGKTGTIGQLSDGQNRIGGGLSPATFTVSNGGITDEAGRGCILTPSVEQFQCDQGVGPTYGFAIESNGTLISSGSSVFYACPASDTEWNLYTTPVIGQEKCVEISLTASGCGAQTSAIQAATTVTVYNCGVPSSTSEVATSAPQVTTSIPVVAESSTSVVAQSSAAESSSSYATVSETTVPSVPESSSVVVSIPTVVPVEASSSVYAQTSSLAISTGTVIPVEVSSSVYVQTSVPLSTISTVPVEESSSIYVQTTLPISPSGTAESVSSQPIISSTSVIITSTSQTPATSSLTVSSTYTSSSTSSTVLSSTSSCATALTGSSTSGNYQYPHLIIPVSSVSPTTAYGSSYFGNISSTTSTLFNFDIPTSYSGHTCSLIFLLPLSSQLETSSYTFSGSGSIDFLQMAEAATQETTWDTVPSVEEDLGTFTVSEGSSTLVESFACPAGETVTFEMKAEGDTSLYWFEDWNPSPLGLFITYC